MSPLPKTIQIFLPDGNPRSVRIAEITSRTVQAIQVPRGVIDRAADRTELKHVGVYFLFGEADEGELPLVYVGEAEDCWVRLNQHHRDGQKDYWTHAVVITSKTQRFDKGQGRWLEWYATHEAIRAGRYQLQNQCAAREPHLTEPVKADLYDHFDTLRILVATLGFPLFEPAIDETPVTAPVGQPEAPRTPAPQSKKPLPPVDAGPELPVEPFFFVRKRRADARGQLTADGFVVAAGSVASPTTVPSFEKLSGNRVRSRLIRDGVIEERDGKLVFARDYVFRTPSGAADVVLGRSANGWIEWTDDRGRTLDEVKRNPPS